LATMARGMTNRWPLRVMSKAALRRTLLIILGTWIREPLIT
jgi:hypothetical protein